MKHIITYMPRHKEVIEHAINMALDWHKGDIEPVCNVMLTAYIRHHDVEELTPDVTKFVHSHVSTIRQIDANGEAFGKHETLAHIQLSNDGETVITEQEAYALEHLSDAVMRLMVGQVSNCFDNFNIPSIEFGQSNELRKLSDELHVHCWNVTSGRLFGIRYSEESDILYDIHQVLRHERFLNFSDEQKERARWTVLADKPMHTAKEQLIKIKTLIENDE